MNTLPLIPSHQGRGMKKARRFYLVVINLPTPNEEYPKIMEVTFYGA